MRRLIAKKWGYCVEKVFSFANQNNDRLSVRADKWGGCCVTWWYHVAPVLRVRFDLSLPGHPPFPLTLLMVIDENGRLAGYHINMADLPAEKVVADFMDALVDGRFVAASSFLSPEMQEEISPANLQRKWQLLQRRTGNFIKVRRIARSESTADAKLLLVNTQFTRSTDNLFVILDNSNQIVGIDFPTDPQATALPAQP
jgi:hypothetical protein